MNRFDLIIFHRRKLYGCPECACLTLPCPGGVIVMVCAVNSSSKYLVSVSDVTWGLNGGTSCCGGEDTQKYQYIRAFNQFGTICQSDDNPCHA